MSPWASATRDKDGVWHLPLIPCEIDGLPADDPRNKPWKPGEYIVGVDNVEEIIQGGRVVRKEWGGQKLWNGDRPPPDWDASQYPEQVQRVLKVPHMPGQPMKERFARQKAWDPRPFEDREFENIVRNLPEAWPKMLRQVCWFEGFGIHTEDAPAEWAGQKHELVPAVYVSPRLDMVTICVGTDGTNEQAPRGARERRDCEYDYLEFLYARDQDGKLIQIRPFPSYGMFSHRFSTYSFVPPEGTTEITPFACFKVRGAWKGTTIEWDPKVKNLEMDWFTALDTESWARMAKPRAQDNAVGARQTPASS